MNQTELMHKKKKASTKKCMAVKNNNDEAIEGANEIEFHNPFDRGYLVFCFRFFPHFFSKGEFFNAFDLGYAV